MTAEITITAGRQGGDFDAFIAHMGAPRDFGMSSRGPNHIIFSEGRGGVGQTIDMIRQLGDTTQELRLHDSGDLLLMTPNRNTRGFGVSNQSDADSVLDNMMNSLQSGALGLYPMSLSFGGNAGELRLKVVAAGVIVQGDTDGDGQADFAITLAGALGVEVGAFLLV